jgi:hypothetical protein
MKKLAAILIVFSTSAIYALGTDANTDIDNEATLSYKAGGVKQPDVSSNTDSFKVDKKIDMILSTSDTDQVKVTPGQQDRITSFSFKNEGNSKENFKFEVANLANDQEADYDSDKDNKDVEDDMVIEYSTDDGGSWSTLPNDGILEVAEDDTIKLRVKADIKDSSEVEDKDIMNIELKATAYKDDKSAKEEETTGAETQDKVDIVFADGESNSNNANSGLGDSSNSKGDTAGDGVEVARSGYIIATPVLSVTKSSCVLSDPVNNTDNPKRIPGAKIRYLFDVNNTGTSDVSDSKLTDDFDDYLDLSNTKDSVKKTENQDDACVCTTEGKSDASGDTTIDNQKMTIEHINVAAGSTQSSDGEKHTCITVTVEVK